MKFPVLMLALLLAACTPSLQPLYTAQDVVFDPALLGSWKQAQGKARFVATRGEGDSYAIAHNENGAIGHFTARLVQLGMFRFVDLYPEDPQFANGFYKGHLVSAHTFGRISMEGEQLRIALLDPDWIKDETPQLQRTMLDHTLVLTAPTAELRAFAVKHAETKAFDAVSKWVRER